MANKLFTNFPLNGTAQLSTGTVKTPYHIYDGYGLFIGGTADLNAVKGILSKGGLHPIVTTAGRAVVGLWLMNFTQASLAPHSEFQCSIFVNEQPLEPLPAYPFATLNHFVRPTPPAPAILCADIWNNTAECVAYNSELLGLGAKLCQSTFTRQGNTVQFNFTADGAPLVAGEVQMPSQSSASDNWLLMKQFGFLRTLRLTYGNYTALDVINAISPSTPTHRRAHSYTKFKHDVVARFDAAKGRIRFGDIPFNTIDFQAECAQLIDDLNFVYLTP